MRQGAPGSTTIMRCMEDISYVLPATTSFRRFLMRFISMIDVTTPSSMPNILSSPRVSNIRKNNTDHTGAAGSWLMASVKAMKASPVPDPLWILKYILVLDPKF